MRSTVGLPDLEEIFLTHFHADHYLGLPGMLKTFQLRQRELPLTVYGPPGLRDLFGGLRRVFGKLSYPLELVEVRAGRGARARRLPDPRLPGASRRLGRRLRARRARPARAASTTRPPTRSGSRSGPERGALQRGESITLPDGRVLTPDAVLGAAASRAGASSSRATRHRSRRCACSPRAPTCSCTRRRSATRSATARRTRCTRPRRQAAEIARDAGVRLLALTHISPRYFGAELAREARAVFPATVVPRDFDTIEVPFAERGEPALVKGGAKNDAKAPTAPVAETALGAVARRRRGAPAPRARPSSAR